MWPSSPCKWQWRAMAWNVAAQGLCSDVTAETVRVNFCEHSDAAERSQDAIERARVNSRRLRQFRARFGLSLTRSAMPTWPQHKSPASA